MIEIRESIYHPQVLSRWMRFYCKRLLLGALSKFLWLANWVSYIISQDVHVHTWPPRPSVASGHGGLEWATFWAAVARKLACVSKFALRSAA